VALAAAAERAQDSLFQPAPMNTKRLASLCTRRDPIILEGLFELVLNIVRIVDELHELSARRSSARTTGRAAPCRHTENDRQVRRASESRPVQAPAERRTKPSSAPTAARPDLHPASCAPRARYRPMSQCGVTFEPMPTYKNRPQKPDDTPVWRYLNLSGVIATIKTRKLRLTRVDTFRDLFEGSVPKKQMEVQDILLSGAGSKRAMLNSVFAWFPGMGRLEPPDEDPWLQITRLRRAQTRCAHASCWSLGHESELLWRLYCRDNGSPWVGVALRTTLARLEKSVAAHDLYVSPITYVPYHEAPPFTDEMDSLLHKRRGFDGERELRLLKFDKAHYNLLVPKDASVPELPEHIYLNWVLTDVIDKIIISPYADNNYEELVHLAINAADPSLAARVELSELHERCHPARF
jgi:hypothetical protein